MHWSGARRASWIRCNGSDLVRITDQISSLIRARIARVCDISTRQDIEDLPSSCGEDAIHLPVADDIVHQMITSGELLTGAEGEFVKECRSWSQLKMPLQAAWSELQVRQVIKAPTTTAQRGMWATG